MSDFFFHSLSPSFLPNYNRAEMESNLRSCAVPLEEYARELERKCVYFAEIIAPIFVQTQRESPKMPHIPDLSEFPLRIDEPDGVTESRLSDFSSVQERYLPLDAFYINSNLNFSLPKSLNMNEEFF